MINTDNLNESTRAVFDLLVNASELSGMCLIGGTALTLHLNHRNSLDLDFTSFNKGAKLPTFKIDQIIQQLRESNHQADLITNHASLQQHKINTGDNLHDYARDYVIDGIKVTFFSGINKPSSFYELMQRCAIDQNTGGFSILSLDGLKISKSLILDDRVRSRDLYDIMWLMQNNHLKIQTFFTAIDTYANNNDPEYYKAVLRGDIPMDHNDEGLDPVGLKIEMKEIYQYFSSVLDRHEQHLAKSFFESKANNS